MSDYHVLTGGNQVYLVVVHTATPAGNNLAGVPWSSAVRYSGRNRTQMTPGTGPGQILQAEADEIGLGTILEGSFSWQPDFNATSQERLQDLEARVENAKADIISSVQKELELFGLTS